MISPAPPRFCRGFAFRPQGMGRRERGEFLGVVCVPEASGSAASGQEGADPRGRRAAGFKEGRNG